MSFLTSIKRALGIAAPIAGTALTKAVAAVAQKGNPIGEAAIAAVAASQTAGGTGASKKAAALAEVKPVVTAELAKGSLAAIEADVETFASMVIEEVVAQLKTSGPLAIALQLLTLLGVH